MNQYNRKISIILAVIMIISLLVGCADDSDGGEGSNNSPGNPGSIPGDGIGLSEVVYLSEIIQFPELPGGKTSIDNIVLANEKVYFTATGPRIENNTFEMPGIFSMDVDGTNLEELSNYIASSILPETAQGSLSVNAMVVDELGNIWVYEYVFLYEVDLPDDFTSDDNENFEGNINTSSINIVRKLDNTGAEVFAFAVNDLATSTEWFYISAFIIDNAGNVYLASGSKIYVLDDHGRLLFTLENSDFSAQFVQLSDGSVTFIKRLDWDMHLQKIDLERRSWGEVIIMPPDVQGVQVIFSGIGEHLYLFNDNMFLNGIIAETGEHVKLLNWNNSSVSPGEVSSLMFLPDGRIALITQPQRTPGGAEPAPELVLLTAASYEDLPERIILTYGTSYYDNDRRYVVEKFNNSSTTHRIQVIDYSQFNTADVANAGFLRLTTEIISGNSPDIIDGYEIPLNTAATKGYFTDLYPFIDADPELDRRNFIESVLKASETDGHLYRLVPAFSIATLFGHPSVLGSYPGWTLDEFIAVLNANPQADIPLGPVFSTNINILSVGISGDIINHINRTSSAVDFDNEEFIKLLEFANTFPSEPEWDHSLSINALVDSGRYIMLAGSFGSLDSIRSFRTIFGGEIVFKGYPTENRDGNSFSSFTNIAISAACQDKEAAWEFIRLFITEEYQRELFYGSLPINRIVFEERLLEAMEDPGSWMQNDDGTTTDVKGLSQIEVDTFRDIVDNTTVMRSTDLTFWNIISETASDYFNGRITAQEAARVIQNRSSIYIAEQN